MRTEHSDGGFTLIETLIALVILAISAGILMQSIALASAQIRSSALKEAAESLAVAVLCERAANNDNSLRSDGIDAESGLFWRVVQVGQARTLGAAKLTGVTLFTVEIRARENSDLIFDLSSITMKASSQ